MASKSMEVETVDLLHPETLSKETIISILRQRSVRLDRSQDLDKEALVEIFYRTVLPLPQRDFRDNRRGKIMAKLRPKKRVISDVEKYVKNMSDGSPAPKRRTSEGTTGLISSLNIQSTANRLKPPPVVINKNKSVVKLNPRKKDSEVKSPSATSASSSGGGCGTTIKLGSLSSSKNINTQSKKVSLKRPSSEKINPEDQVVKKKIIKIQKPTTSSPSHSTDKSKQERKVSSSSISSSPSSSASSSDSSPTKKSNIKRISWP